MYSQTKGEMPNGTGEMPILVRINNSPYWQASGRTFPQVAGAEDPPPADDDKNEDDEDSEEFDKSRFQALRTRLRDEAKAAKAEAKAAKARADALEAKEQERANADKSELEKAQLKLAAAEKAHQEAQAKLQRALIAQAIERAATKLNARDSEVVAKLIEHDKLTLDDEGNPTNAEDLVKALLKEKAYLVNTASGSGTGVPPTPRSNGQPGREEQVKAAKEKLIATSQYNPIA